MYACVCVVRVSGCIACVCVVRVSGCIRLYVRCVFVCMGGVCLCMCIGCAYACLLMSVHGIPICTIYIYTETKVLLSEYTIKCTSEPMINSPSLFGNKLIKRKLTHNPVFPQLQSFLRPTH